MKAMKSIIITVLEYIFLIAFVIVVAMIISRQIETAAKSIEMKQDILKQDAQDKFEEIQKENRANGTSLREMKDLLDQAYITTQ